MTQFNVNSISTHIWILLDIVKYLINIRLLNIKYESSKNNSENFIEYIDVFYENDKNIRKFHNDYIFFFWNETILYFFKRQKTITIFIIEIEYVDECNANKKICFLIESFHEIKHIIEKFVDIRTNNQTIIKLIHNFVNHFKTKHISIQYHYVRELMFNKFINFIYVFITNMIANEFTKTLKSKLFKRFVKMLNFIENQYYIQNTEK